MRWTGIFLALFAALSTVSAHADWKFTSDADLVAAVMPSFVDINNRRMAPTDASGSIPVIQDEVGSGFIIDPSGLIATNRHVVEGAYALFVTLSDGTQLPATLVGKALNFDFAIIKVDAGRPLQPAKLGDSEALRVGDRVVAIGNPLGFANSASAGIVSALHRQIGLSAFDDVIQTDATINQGNSGGPLFNMNGEVIGVNQAIRAENGGGSIGIGFSIPISQIEFILENVKKYGRPKIGYLGVQGQTFTPGMAAAMKTTGPGVIVSGVIPDSPAAKAGLQIGDVIRKVGDFAIRTTSSLSRAAAISADKTLPIAILRDGQDKMLTATLLEVTQDIWSTQMGTLPAIKDMGDLGVTFETGNGEPVVQNVVERSIAWNAGLRKGDIVRKIYPRDVRTNADLLAMFKDNLANHKTNSLMYLEGPNGARWIQFSLLE